MAANVDARQVDALISVECDVPSGDDTSALDARQFRMTTHVLADVRIGDLQQFLDVFSTDGLAKRQEHRCLGATVFTPVSELDRVMVMLEFEDEADFQSFRDDESAPPIMRRGGAQGPPTFTVLRQVGSYPH